MNEYKEIRIPIKHWIQHEDLQECLVEIISILDRQVETEMIRRCIYWLSKILLFSEYLQ